MSAGKLDQQIGLKSLTETVSGGAITPSYTLAATVFGYVITQRGDEAFESARVNAKETIRVQIRYRADVTVKWRVSWQGQDYNIKAIDRSARRDGYLWITAQVVGAA